MGSAVGSAATGYPLGVWNEVSVAPGFLPEVVGYFGLLGICECELVEVARDT